MSALLSLFAVLVAALLAGRAGAQVRRGDVVVAQPGGLVRLDPATGVIMRIGLQQPPRHPTGVVALPEGDLLVADWAHPRRGAGSVLRIRPLDGGVTVLATGPPLVAPFSLARRADGGVVLGDIDAGSVVYLPSGTPLYMGVLFDLDPVTGALVQRVADCCQWNPLGLQPLGPDEVLVSEAGCCAYSGPGALVVANLATGSFATLPTTMSFHDPVGLALADDGHTLWVAESAMAEPVPPAIRRVDVATGTVTTVVEGAPFQRPTGLLLEDDGRLLVVDELLGAVLRVDPTSAGVTTVAQGTPLAAPFAIGSIDTGDVVSGVAPATPARAACALSEARLVARLASATLRCIATRDAGARTACIESAAFRYGRRKFRSACPACVIARRAQLAAIVPETLERTPGARLDCAPPRSRCRTTLAGAASRLQRDLSRCNGDYLAGAEARDRPALEACHAAARGRFATVGRRVGDCTACDQTTLDSVVAEVASIADTLIGAAFCQP